MTGVISRSNHPKALWPGIQEWFGMSYDEFPEQWKPVFEAVTSDMAYEEDVESTGFGLAPIKTEGGAISYDSHTQGPTTRYTHLTYGLGYVVTREELEDNKYEKVSRARSKALAYSMRETKQIVAANIFNRGFTAAYAGGDGKELFSTAHPTIAGSQSNYLSPAADFSEAALETLLIQISNAKNSRGNRISLQGMQLVVPADLQFEATRVLQSTLRAGTANNDVNAIKKMGLLPDGVHVWQYLDDSDAWFVKTNAPAGLKAISRRAREFTKDNDFDTENAKAKATERYSFGWSDWRAAFGSPGA